MQNKPRILRIVIDEDDAGRVDRDLVSDIVAEAIEKVLAGEADKLELSKDPTDALKWISEKEVSQ